MKRIIFLPFILLLISGFVSQAQTKRVKNKHVPKVFVVLDITVTDSLLYEQYRINVEPVIEKYGGKYLVRSGGMAFDEDPERKVTPLAGNWNPNRFIIIEWDSIEELQTFNKSEEYKSAAALREKSATTKSIMVKEYLK